MEKLNFRSSFFPHRFTSKWRPFGNLGIGVGIGIGIGIGIQVWIFFIKKYKPLELKGTSIYLLSKYLIACNIFVQRLMTILLKPSTFDYVPISLQCLDLVNNIVPKVSLTCTLIFVYLYSLTLSVNGHSLSKIDSSCKI